MPTTTSPSPSPLPSLSVSLSRSLSLSLSLLHFDATLLCFTLLCSASLYYNSDGKCHHRWRRCRCREQELSFLCLCLCLGRAFCLVCSNATESSCCWRRCQRQQHFTHTPHLSFQWLCHTEQLQETALQALVNACLYVCVCVCLFWKGKWAERCNPVQRLV